MSLLPGQGLAQMAPPVNLVHGLVAVTLGLVAVALGLDLGKLGTEFWSFIALPMATVATGAPLPAAFRVTAGLVLAAVLPP